MLDRGRKQYDSGLIPILPFVPIIDWSPSGKVPRSCLGAVTSTTSSYPSTIENGKADDIFFDSAVGQKWGLIAEADVRELLMKGHVAFGGRIFSKEHFAKYGFSGSHWTHDYCQSRS